MPDRRALLVAAGAAALVVVLLAVAMSRPGAAPSTVATGPSTSPATTTTTAPVTTTSVAPTTTTTPPPPPPTEPPTTAPVVVEAPPEPAVAAEPPPAPLAAPTPADVAGTGAYCLGDSVMLGASPVYFGTLTMCAEVDAEVGRQVAAGAAILQAHGPFPATVVVHLGTNGPTTAGELDAMLQVVATVPRVVLVNLQLNGTRSWEASANAEIAAAAGRWPNVRVADWYGASAGHADWFRDGLHLTAPGAEAYAATIAAAL